MARKEEPLETIVRYAWIAMDRAGRPVMRTLDDGLPFPLRVSTSLASAKTFHVGHRTYRRIKVTLEDAPE